MTHDNDNKVKLLQDQLLEEPDAFGEVLAILTNYALEGTEGRSAVCNSHWLKIHCKLVQAQTLLEDFPND